MATIVEFRDGEQPVADHVAWLLRHVDCTTMTKAEAIKESETQMVRDHLKLAQRNLIAKHFQEHRR